MSIIALAAEEHTNCLTSVFCRKKENLKIFSREGESHKNNKFRFLKKIILEDFFFAQDEWKWKKEQRSSEMEKPRWNGVLSPFATMCPRLFYFLRWGRLHFSFAPSQRSAVEILVCLAERSQRSTKQQGDKVVYWPLDWGNITQDCMIKCRRGNAGTAGSREVFRGLRVQCLWAFLENYWNNEEKDTVADSTESWRTVLNSKAISRDNRLRERGNIKG